MAIWQAIVLGIVQGLSEFLPISSSGHLVIIQSILKIPEEMVVSFSIIVHMGTLAAVIIYFYQELKQLLVGLLKLEKQSLQIVFHLILGSLPVVVIIIIARDYVEGLFNNPLLTSFLLIVTGFILLISDRLSGKVRIEELKWTDAVWIGFGQAIAILPGISRAGSTIAAGLWRKMARPDAAKFSFLLSIPVILGAGIFDIGNLVAGGFNRIGPGAFWFGLIASAITGYLVIKFFIAYLHQKTLKRFGYYCMFVGAFAFVAFLL